jgi:hypothetical protein
MLYLIRHLTKHKFISLLYDRQVLDIITEALYHENLIIIKRLFPYFVKLDANIIRTISYSQDYNKLLMLFNLCKRYSANLNINDNELIDVYVENPILLRIILKKYMLKKDTSELIFNKIITNFTPKYRFVLLYLIDKLKLIFDKNICETLYKNKCYDCTCNYIINTYDQTLFDFDLIEQKYSNIINTQDFTKLLFRLNLSVDQANKLLNITKNSRLKKKYYFLIKNIIKLDIVPIE